MIKSIFHSLWITLMTACALQAHTTDYIQHITDHGQVNWTRGEVIATGTGRRSGKDWTAKAKIEAHRAATVDAMRQLVEVMHGIQVDSHTTVKDFTVQDDEIRSRVEGIARNFTETDARFLENGHCEVDLLVPLNGDGALSDVLLETATQVGMDRFASEAKAVEPRLLAKINVPPVGEDPEEDEEADEEQEDTHGETPEVRVMAQKVSLETEAGAFQGAVSGLVINAEDKPIRPALIPSIVTENGTEIYGISKTNRDFRKLNGLASYAADLSDARLDKRVTENPYTLTALDVLDGEPCVVIVSEEEAGKFLELQGSERALNHCRVIIVTQPRDQEIAATV